MKIHEDYNNDNSSHKNSKHSKSEHLELPLLHNLNSSFQSTGIEITKDNILSYTLTNITSSTLGLICLFLMETINLSFMGYSKQSSAYIDAVGLGNIYMNFAGVMIAFGFLGALDTMGSHAFGAKRYKMLGIFTYRSRVILIILFLFVIMPCFLFSDSILSFLGIEEILVENSSFYIKFMLPAIFFTFNFNTNVRYLQVMQIYFFPSVIILISLILHYVMSYVFVYYFEMGIFSVCLSTTLTMFFNLISTTLYIYYENPYPESLFLYDPAVFSFKDLLSYIYLTLYSGLQHYGESIGYEVVSFMTCFLPAQSMASNLIILNYINLLGFIYLGVNFPLTHFVGYFLGKEDFPMYKYTVKFFVIFNIFFCVAEFLFTYILSLEICVFYTNNLEVAKVASLILRIYAIFLVLDTINIMFQCILKGAGMQRTISLFNLVLTFCFMIPAGYILCFTLGQGLNGLWLACGLFVSLSTLVNFVLFLKMNIKQAAEILKEQLVEEEHEFSYLALK